MLICEGITLKKKCREGDFGAGLPVNFYYISPVETVINWRLLFDLKRYFSK
jgi:hypothetical protein